MFDSVESFLAVQRAENRSRHAAARQDAINSSRSIADCLTEIFIADAAPCLIAGFTEEGLQKGFDTAAAAARAQKLYAAQCVSYDPKQEFGDYATLHYP